MSEDRKVNYKAFIPFLIFILLGVLMWFALGLDGEQTPSALIGKKMPSFEHKRLDNQNVRVTEDIFNGKITIMNVWASWCWYCRAEHPFLMEQSRVGGYQWIGLNYKDTVADATDTLNELGNPYRYSIFDPKGKLAINLGVLGTPETFIIDDKSIIRFRFSGAIDKTVWNQYFVPILKTIENQG